MSLPSIIAVPKVYAANQVGNTRWSPFGPQEQYLMMTVYGAFQNMFTAFMNGQVDITDWPVLPQNLGTGSSAAYCDSSFNPDYFCTTPTQSLDFSYLNINQYNEFLGVSMHVPRSPPTPSAVFQAYGSSCSPGFGQFRVFLYNNELPGQPLIKDSLNSLTISNQPSGYPSATVTDSGGASPNGYYVFPCILSGNYTLSSSVYAGSPTVSIVGDCGVSGSGCFKLLYFYVNWDSTSASEPSPWGVQINRAISHLINSVAFDSVYFGAAANPPSYLGNSGVICDNPVGVSGSSTSGICQANLNEECTGSNPSNAVNPHPWVTNCSPDAPYLLTSQFLGYGSYWWANAAVGAGYPSQDDLRAACDDFVLAGFTVVNGANPTDCSGVSMALGGTTAPSGPYPHLSNNGHQIVDIIRTDSGLEQFGTIIADGLNALFGTPNDASTSYGGTCTINYGRYLLDPNNVGNPSCSPFYHNLTGDPSGIVYNSPYALSGLPPWNIYTTTTSLNGQGDDSYTLFNSAFAGAAFCTGIPFNRPSNYEFYCDPAYDTWTSAGEFGDSSNYSWFFNRAFLAEYRNAFVVPVYSGIDTFVELNGWNFQQCTGAPCVNTESSLVNAVGHGTEAGSGFWTMLNARQVPNYNPSNLVNTPGGGNPDLIRYGFSQTVDNLNPFIAPTEWDSEVVSLIYDSMLKVNPLEYPASGQLMDWMTTSHSSTFSASQVSCLFPLFAVYTSGIVPSCSPGTTTQVWHLRNDLRFSDGVRLTAADVCYSIDAYQKMSSKLFPKVAFVSYVGDLTDNPTPGCVPLNPATVTITLQGNSPFYETNIGGLPIVPEHVWGPICGDPIDINSTCGSYSFDPMSMGMMIGSGPWSCVVPTGFSNAGHVGGPCTESAAYALAGQAVDVGGRIFLQRNTQYFRCCPSGPGAMSSSLYKESYADKNNDGVVNIQDLASAAACFGLAAGESNTICTSLDSAYWVNSNIAMGSTVNISDLATVAYYFNAGVVSYGGRSVLSSMTGIDPQIDPFFCPTTGC